VDTNDVPNCRYNEIIKNTQWIVAVVAHATHRNQGKIFWVLWGVLTYRMQQFFTRTSQKQASNIKYCTSNFIAYSESGIIKDLPLSTITKHG